MMNSGAGKISEPDTMGGVFPGVSGACMDREEVIERIAEEKTGYYSHRY